MSNFSKFAFPLLLSVFFAVSAVSARAAVINFANPLTKSSSASCATSDLRNERFSSEISADERIKLCRALENICAKLNSNNWSPALAAELKSVWQIFSQQNVSLRSMPDGASPRIAAMAEPFPSGAIGKKFEACVHVRAEKSDGAFFFLTMLHELRHVYDFYELWKNKTALNSIEVERRAFLLMGKINQETPEKEHFFNFPTFWKESWRNLSSDEITAKREAAVEKYLRGNQLYSDLNKNNQTYDFSFMKTLMKPISDSELAAKYKNDGERLPRRPSPPPTDFTLPQNLDEVDLDLEKPKNPRDAKEILRVALANEKKLYYGMGNFVYDRKLELQCWKKGRAVATINETIGIARNEKGELLIQNNTAQLPLLPACVANYQNIETDFTETFRASPALEKMPVTFAGFVEIDGKTLARYTVWQPDAKLFAQLAKQYSSIKPFRVFVGTIFISPEDGQIVKFWGTTLSAETSPSNAQKIWGDYSVTALRQKLNVNGGAWVTVFIGTAALANIEKNPQPFSYSVNFTNFRQATTDVKILDDAVIAGTDAGLKRISPK